MGPISPITVTWASNQTLSYCTVLHQVQSWWALYHHGVFKENMWVFFICIACKCLWVLWQGKQLYCAQVIERKHYHVIYGNVTVCFWWLVFWKRWGLYLENSFSILYYKPYHRRATVSWYFQPFKASFQQPNHQKRFPISLLLCPGVLWCD